MKMSYITCKNVSFAYENQIVVSGLDFQVNAGDYLCIIGENGTGKTTLIKTILQLLPFQEGTITWKESEIKDIFDDIAYITDTLSFLPDMNPRTYGSFLKDFYPKFNMEALQPYFTAFEIDSRKRLKKMSSRTEAEG